MQPLRRALLNSLRPTKTIATQCLTTTTSNEVSTATSCLKAAQSRLFTRTHHHARLLRSNRRNWPCTFAPTYGGVCGRTELRTAGGVGGRSISQSAVSRGGLTEPPAGQEEGKSGEGVEEADVQRPSYELWFTCKPCGERSKHTVSKQGYHRGTVLVACPGCKARHLITDHLKIFGDTPRGLEQLLKENGEILKRGHINPEGDIEIWPEGAVEDSEVDIKAVGDGNGNRNGEEGPAKSP